MRKEKGKNIEHHNVTREGKDNEKKKTTRKRNTTNDRQLAHVAEVAAPAIGTRAGRSIAAARSVRPAELVLARRAADLGPASHGRPVRVPRHSRAVANRRSAGRQGSAIPTVLDPANGHVVAAALGVKGGGPHEARPRDGDLAVLAAAVVVRIVRRAEAGAALRDRARAGGHAERRQRLRRKSGNENK